MHARSILHDSTRWLSRKTIFSITIILILTVTSAAWGTTATPGLADDFQIDGNLFSNNPGATGNDWLDGPAGIGSGVLFADGTPKDLVTTAHILDLIGGDDQDVFSAGKVLDDPNTYEWKAGSVPQKDDLQNGLVHFWKDGVGDHWISLAGDRKSISGSSYIDFEFLQHTLTQNADGSFSSSGPDGGRTIGDLLLTIELDKGGAQANFFVQKWVEDGNGGYTYADVQLPPGHAFVSANIDSMVNSTYDTFGSTSYDINQLGEAAVNLSALLPSFDECFAIATIFVRTKSSTSVSAALKDFMEPIQINKCLDESAPDITPPPDITVSCSASIEPGQLGYAGASDNCTPEDLTIAYTDEVVPGNCPNGLVIYRNWTATDLCGNTTEATQVITVVDDVPPSITAGPPPISVQCGTLVPAPDPTLISAVDECGGVNVIHFGDDVSGSSCDQVITRTYRAMDDCGNTTDYVQVITIKDTTPPQMGAMAPISVECGSEVPAPNTALVSASDNCNGVSITHVEDNFDGNSCPQVITRTYRATDQCGNYSEVAQIITVNDETAPLISGPPDETVECSQGIPPASIGAITASDNCGNVVVTHVQDTSDNNTCPQVITRTYRATDQCGNSSDWVQLITVHDTTAPEVEGPPNATVDCVEEVPPADTRLIVALDNCGYITVSHVGDVSNGQMCPELITRTYRATDNCGNSTDYVQVYTVDDRTPPQATAPDDITVQCAEAVPPYSRSSVTVSDNCGLVTVEHIADYSDNKRCPETITRVYRARDYCGNTTEVMQYITIDDDTPPQITEGPPPVRIQCYDDMPSAAPSLVYASDNCGEVTVVHYGDDSDGESCPETITRTYRAYDECGNYSDFVQTITIHDDTPPQLSSCPTDKVLECPDAFTFDPPSATDNCDENPSVFVLADYEDLAPWTYNLRRVWAAVDDCGNTSVDCSQSISASCEGRSLGTFTQGFWGNYGGKFNDIPTIEIIRGILESGPVVVGKEGRSLSIPLKSADCIVARLPGGTTPTTLPESFNDEVLHPDANGNHDACQTNKNKLPVDYQGKIENVLLSQTITLTLNTRLSMWLYVMPLSEQFCTQRALAGDDGLLGTADDELDEIAIARTFYIDISVLKAIDAIGEPRLVAGLLELANQALAGWDTHGASLSAINNAATAINEGFDRVRFLVDCEAVTLSKGGTIGDRDVNDASSVFDTGSGPLAAPSAPTHFELGQNYPNPFNPTTRIQVALPLASNWSVSIYNVKGELVRRYDGATRGAAFVSVQWDGTDRHGAQVASGVYIYRVRAGDFTDVKRMVLLK